MQHKFLADVAYDGQLSFSAYIMLMAVLFIILGGLGWCFYRAIKGSNSGPDSYDAQKPTPRSGNKPEPEPEDHPEF